MQPLKFDYHGAFLPGMGMPNNVLVEMAPLLSAARQDVWDDLAQWHSGGAVPSEKQPLDAGFVDLPERMLAAYAKDRHGSELGRMLQVAKRIQDECDLLVVLGIGGSYMGARALFEACCHPFHNALSRGERGGKPRLLFDGFNLDNDYSSGLLDLLPSRPKSKNPEDQYAVSVISKSGATLETAVALRLHIERLRQACGSDELLSTRLIPVTGASGRLFDLSKALGCKEVFSVPDGVGGRFSVFSAVGLLPAAVVGLDVVHILEGAAAMNACFRDQPFDNNPVLEYVGVCHVWEAMRGAVTRIFCAWANGLEAAGLWYDQLLSESLGKQERGALPLTVINTRDLHSRGQQHQEGRRDKLITHLVVDATRRDPLRVPQSARDQDQLNALAGRPVPQLLDAAIRGTDQAYHEAQRPTTMLHLPKLDEGTMGQLLQMLMLATVVEGRLIGINPYGQPGVEHYKRNMQAFLKGTQ